MLFAIFDPEFLNQLNGIWENFKTTRRENPEAFAISMWCFGFVLWGGILYYRSSKQPIAWSEFGKPLYEALQNTTIWKWYTNEAQNGIYCDINNQILDCKYDGNFTINRVTITEHLSKQEIKELLKLKNKIVELRKAEAQKEKDKQKELDKQKILSQLALVNQPTKKEDKQYLENKDILQDLTQKEKIILRSLNFPNSWRWFDNGQTKDRYIINSEYVIYDTQSKVFYINNISSYGLVQLTEQKAKIFTEMASNIIMKLIK
jgi:hypothetical protein